MLGMGAGKYADAQYLFTEDVCGYGKNHKPRHGKVYRDLGSGTRSASRTSASPRSGTTRPTSTAAAIPGPEHTVPIGDDEFDAFLKAVGLSAMRIGVVGYGTGGRHFHTPFIVAADGCELSGIVARAPATVAAARGDWPDVPVFPSLTAMIGGRRLRSGHHHHAAPNPAGTGAGGNRRRTARHRRQTLCSQCRGRARSFGSGSGQRA